MKKITTIIYALFFTIMPAIGQQLGYGALKGDYPLLMQKFGGEVKQQKAAYFFVIDVSGSMNQYKPIVEPALKEFFCSLQDGDYVDVIRFGEEAEKVTGCYGDITRDKITSLCRNAENIYFKEKPGNTEQKLRFWNNTNLTKALDVLANEMHQLGLTNTDGAPMMKFVFLITDFEHEPASRGSDNWSQIKQRFENEHNSNLVNIVALQLPGNATHLNKVKSTFPNHFLFKSQPVADGPALGSWFTDIKNKIMYERFRALVLGKVKDANIKMTASIDINGNIVTTVKWMPNELFDNFTITSLSVEDPDWKLNSFAPVTITDDSVKLSECKLVYKNKPLFPLFSSLHSDVVASIAFNDSLINELKSLLGDEAPTIATVSTAVNRSIFCHHLTLGWSIFALALVVLYIVMIFVAVAQNRKGRIYGTFYVVKEGLEITQRKPANGLNKIAIGDGAPFLPVPDCLWKIEISEKKVPAIVPLIHFRSPSYNVLLVRGNEYTVAGNRHRRGTAVRLNRRGTVIVEKEYYIHWII